MGTVLNNNNCTTREPHNEINVGNRPTIVNRNGVNGRQRTGLKGFGVINATGNNRNERVVTERNVNRKWGT